MKNGQSSFLTVFSLALTCVLAGGFIGAATSMVNGAVSPYYFKSTMHWEFHDIWIASVAQGVLEGSLYGILFAIVFASGFGLITKGQAIYRFALEQLLKIIAVVFVCWIIGGLLAMFLAALSPDFYKAHFPFTPPEKVEMLKFAWVGGSIWGGMMGGLLSALLGVVVIKNNWAKESITL